MWDAVLDFLTYFWWVIIIAFCCWYGTGVAIRSEKIEGFFKGLGVGLLVNLVIILLGPALHFLVTVYFADDYCTIEKAEGLVIGASAIAGVLVLGFIALVITIVEGVRTMKDWEKICTGKSFRLYEDGSTRTFREKEYIYAKAIGDQIYYRAGGSSLVINPHYGEDSERGKAKYKYDNHHWDIYVIF